MMTNILLDVSHWEQEQCVNVSLCSIMQSTGNQFSHPTISFSLCKWTLQMKSWLSQSTQMSYIPALIWEAGWLTIQWTCTVQQSNSWCIAISTDKRGGGRWQALGVIHDDWLTTCCCSHFLAQCHCCEGWGWGLHGLMAVITEGTFSVLIL